MYMVQKTALETSPKVSDQVIESANNPYRNIGGSGKF